MENWKLELSTEGQILTEAKTQSGIFQGDSLSPLKFVITMMPLIHIFRKCTGGNKFIKSQEKVNYLMYIGNIKLFTKNEKTTRTPDTNNKNIQPVYRNTI